MTEQLNTYQKNLLRKINMLGRIDDSNPYHRLIQIENIFNYLDINFEKIHDSNSFNQLKFIRVARQTAMNILHEIDTILFTDHINQFPTDSLKKNTRLLLRRYITRNKAMTNPSNPQAV